MEGNSVATTSLENHLRETGGGVQSQLPFRLPDSLPAGVPRTCWDEVEPQSYLGPLGQHREIRNADGLALQTYWWPAAPEGAKAVILFVHGHGAHCLFELLKQTTLGQPTTYEGSWPHQWNQQGISVCSLDLQGCGRSEGKRGLRFYVERFDDYVSDVLQLARLVNSESLGIPGFAGLPIFICGISLGGCISFHATLADKASQEGLLKGAILMAPMLSLEKVSRQGLNPYIRPLANLLNKLIPTAAIVATDRNTLYPDIQALWDADPLTNHISTRVRCASEFLRITELSMRRLADFTAPFLVFHSENDTMVDCDGSKALYLQSKSEDKALRLVNHMWHILVREEGNEKLCAEIAEWVLQRAS